MSTADLRSLQIRPDADDPALAQQQARFNTLLADVAAGRAALADWKDRIGRYQQAVAPVRRELHQAWRQWVFALDDASLQPGLSRAERAQLGELVCQAATALLDEEADPELAAVLARHQQAPAASPVQGGGDADADEGDDATDDTDATPDWERQAERAAAERAGRASQRRAASAQRRQQQATQEVSQSLRDVYRRLASVLHPDREPDAQRRGHKTALMQQANQAYAQGNLLALLELQLQAEQLDAAQLRAVDHRRLAHYVVVLQEQLAELQAETRRLEVLFRAAAGAGPGSGLQPRKADRLVSAQVQRLRDELLQVQRQSLWLADVDTLRSWLREVRKA